MPKSADITAQLFNDFGLTPVMAAEIECYVVLPDSSKETMELFWAPIDQDLRAAKVPLLRIEKERGEHQFELVTSVTSPEYLAWALGTMRATVEHHANHYGYPVSFDAKPLEDQPSSGMHLHLHLADASGLNVFHKTEEWTSDALRWSIGGLIATLKQAMQVFFPHKDDYLRLADADHVPKIASWGVNNRYCALRIPMNEDPYDKRIEHRVPCANADPEQAITAMLEGVLIGLHGKIEPPAQEYGKPSIGLLQSLEPPAPPEPKPSLTEGEVLELMHQVE